MFDQLTTAEMTELNRKLHRGCIRTLDAASLVIGQMARMSIRHPRYDSMQAMADSLNAAASETSKISSEAGAEWLARMSG